VWSPFTNLNFLQAVPQKNLTAALCHALTWFYLTRLCNMFNFEYLIVIIWSMWKLMGKEAWICDVMFNFVKLNFDKCGMGVYSYSLVKFFTFSYTFEGCIFINLYGLHTSVSWFQCESGTYVSWSYSIFHDITCVWHTTCMQVSSVVYIMEIMR